MSVRTRSDGFTVVELMVVVMIIGILAAMATASYWFTTTRSYSVTCRNNRSTLTRSVIMFEAEHEGDAPSSIDDLEPFVQNFDGSVTCPEDPTKRLFLDGDTLSVVCPLHGE